MQAAIEGNDESSFKKNAKDIVGINCSLLSLEEMKESSQNASINLEIDDVISRNKMHIVSGIFIKIQLQKERSHFHVLDIKLIFVLINFRSKVQFQVTTC